MDYVQPLASLQDASRDVRQLPWPMKGQGA
jgi:hypothetical protein